jgi:hypothetical protein
MRHDLGKMGWPLPRGIVLADRSTGTPTLIGHNTAGTELLLLPNPEPLWRGEVRDYHLLDSPLGKLLVYIDNGALSYELAPTHLANTNSEPLYTLNLASRKATCEITAANVEALGDPLTLSCIVIGQVQVIIDGVGPGPTSSLVYVVGVYETGVYV